jgi:flavin reductase (DIM6/NTAB) family NADH-FMN oxidoreductase RutF
MSSAALVTPDLATRLKTVLRGMPGPVAIVTTRDTQTGQPAGLAASAIIPVSMAPPSMLVCVNRSASAHAVIEASGQFCINLIGARQTALANAFSSSALRHQRFNSEDWDENHGLPHLPAAPASLFCVVRTTLLFGTHEAFIGEVFDITVNGAEQQVGWLEGAFAQFKPIATLSQRHPEQNGTML